MERMQILMFPPPHAPYDPSQSANSFGFFLELQKPWHYHWATHRCYCLVRLVFPKNACKPLLTSILDIWMICSVMWWNQISKVVLLILYEILKPTLNIKCLAKYEN